MTNFYEYILKIREKDSRAQPAQTRVSGVISDSMMFYTGAPLTVDLFHCYANWVVVSFNPSGGVSLTALCLLVWSLHRKTCCVLKASNPSDLPTRPNFDLPFGFYTKAKGGIALSCLKDYYIGAQIRPSVCLCRQHGG